MKRIYIAVLLACGIALPAIAQQQVAAPSESPSADTKPHQERDAKECRTQVVTGSRFKKKICYSADEWQRIDQAHKDKMREIDSQPLKQRAG